MDYLLVSIIIVMITNNYRYMYTLLAFVSLNSEIYVNITQFILAIEVVPQWRLTNFHSQSLYHRSYEGVVFYFSEIDFNLIHLPLILPLNLDFSDLYT